MPALAAEPPAAALLALREHYERTLAIMDVASAQYWRAEDAYFDLKAALPGPDDGALRKAYCLIPAESAWSTAVSDNLDVIL